LHLKRPAFVLALAAALLSAPALILGTLQSHSAPQNLAWAAQFSEQFRAGILYPRWMPDSFDGLGGPAFYFYPPLAFWLDALLSVITFNLVSVAHRLPITWWAMLWAAGLAMHAWLKDETGRPTIAFWGALGYMAAPYHLLVDHYIRGAFAESAAYVFLPLVALGIRRTAERHACGKAVLALSYCGLLMSHLPTALLASTTVLPAYAAFRTRHVAKLLHVAAGGTLGAGLAAIYIVPAMTLQGWISADLFWTGFYRVDNWFLLTPGRWPESIIMQIIASIAAAAFILGTGLCVLSRGRGEAIFWAVAGLVCIALLAGALPWFWQLPGLAKVQFPWRMMVLVEFALVTALCLAPLTPFSRSKIYLCALCLAILAPGIALGLSATADAIDHALSHGELNAQDVKEYEPHGFAIAPELTYAELGLDSVKNVPEISCTPPASLCRAIFERFGAMRLEIKSRAPTHVVLRRFYFPAWKLEGEPIALSPTKKRRLVFFTAPAGHAQLRLLRATLPEEWLGWVISGVSLALLLAASAFSARSSSR
jgi:hypothetical protein